MATFEYVCTFVIEGDDQEIKMVAMRNSPPTVGNTPSSDADAAAIITSDAETALRAAMFEAQVTGNVDAIIRERLAPLEVSHDMNRDVVRRVGQEGPTADHGEG